MMDPMTDSIVAFDTALGTCAVRWTDAGIASVRLPSARTADLPRLADTGDVPGPVREAVAAIVEVLAGGARDLRFVALDERGIDDLRRAVYAATRDIPAGATRTYGEIARAFSIRKA